VVVCGVPACAGAAFKPTTPDIGGNMCLCTGAWRTSSIQGNTEGLKDDGGTSVRLGVSDGRPATPKVRLGCHHSTALWCVTALTRTGCRCPTHALTFWQSLTSQEHLVLHKYFLELKLDVRTSAF
jgi:hypothetical protein